jgi:hypothetical protein
VDGILVLSLEYSLKPKLIRKLKRYKHVSDLDEKIKSILI